MNADDPTASGPDFEARVRNEARAWVVRRDDGLDESALKELRRWLDRGPVHQRTFAEADWTRSALDWPLANNAIREVLDSLEERRRRRQQRRQRLLAIAAMAIVLTGVIYWNVRPLSETPVKASPATSLAVLEPTNWLLPDGTRVTLRHDGAVTPRYTNDRREVVLERGAAYFEVQPEAGRPFVVVSGSVTARAVGTAFSVERSSASVEVIVTEGSVSVGLADFNTAESAARTLILSAGERAQVDPETQAFPELIRDVAGSAVGDHLAWRIPRLEFSATPLEEIVSAVNLHTSKRIEIAHPAIGRFQISGAMRADRIESLISMIEADFAIEVQRLEDRIILRPRS